MCFWSACACSMPVCALAGVGEAFAPNRTVSAATAANWTYLVLDSMGWSLLVENANRIRGRPLVGSEECQIIICFPILAELLFIKRLAMRRLSINTAERPQGSLPSLPNSATSCPGTMGLIAGLLKQANGEDMCHDNERP